MGEVMNKKICIILIFGCVVNSFIHAANQGTTNFTGDLSVGGNKFTIAAASGDTIITGHTTVSLKLYPTSDPQIKATYTPDSRDNPLIGTLSIALSQLSITDPGTLIYQALGNISSIAPI